MRVEEFILDDSEETEVLLWDVYPHVSNGHFTWRHGKSLVRGYENVLCGPRSNMVLCESGSGYEIVFDKRIAPVSVNGVSKDGFLDKPTPNISSELVVKVPTSDCEVGEVVSAFMAQDYHFGHFVSETLMDLVTLWGMGFKKDVVMNADMDKVAREIVEAVAAHHGVKLIFIPTGKFVFAKKCWVLPQNAVGHAWCNTLAFTDTTFKSYKLEAISSVRDILFTHWDVTPITGRRYFFTRLNEKSKDQASGRACLNVQQLNSVFERHGFEVIDFGAQTSTADRLTTLGGARDISFLYGSSIYNLIFTRDPVKSMVIGPYNRTNVNDCALFRNVRATYFQSFDSTQSVHPSFHANLPLIEKYLAEEY